MAGKGAVMQVGSRSVQSWRDTGDPSGCKRTPQLLPFRVPGECCISSPTSLITEISVQVLHLPGRCQAISLHPSVRNFTQGLPGQTGIVSGEAAASSAEVWLFAGLVVPTC